MLTTIAAGLVGLAIIVTFVLCVSLFGLVLKSFTGDFFDGMPVPMAGFLTLMILVITCMICYLLGAGVMGLKPFV